MILIGNIESLGGLKIGMTWIVTMFQNKESVVTRTNILIFDEKMEVVAFIIERIKEWWPHEEPIPTEYTLRGLAEDSILNGSMSIDYIPSTGGNYMIIDDMSKNVRNVNINGLETYDIYHLLPLSDTESEDGTARLG